MNKKNWDTSTSSQVSKYNSFVLDIYLDHKFQEICKRFAVETLLRSLESVIQINPSMTPLQIILNMNKDTIWMSKWKNVKIIFYYISLVMWQKQT